MMLLKDISVVYNLLNYGGKTLRHTLVTFSTKNLILTNKVIKNLDLSIHSGTIYGIIGKNGAGKSTLLKAISGILPISSGSISLPGSISPIISMNAFTDGDLSVLENIRFFANLRGYDKALKNQFEQNVLKFTNYEDEELIKPVKTFSHGMVSRLNIALGIFDDNDIFLIDEALSVGDIELLNKAKNELTLLKEKGKIIILISHNLRIMESFCDTIGILENGKISASGEPSEIINNYRN